MPKKLPSRKTVPNPLSDVPAAEAAAPAKPARKSPARRKGSKTAIAQAPAFDQDVQTAAAPLRIDYPQAGETIVSSQYTLRITAPEGTPAVDVSIDGGPWLACRFAVGHWWFDWADYGPGPHSLSVRCDGGATERLARVEYAPK